MQTRTSDTHPIAVNWAAGPSGSPLGLTFAPGKRHASSLGDYRWERDVDADLDRLVGEHGAEVLVCLLEDHELRSLGIPDLVEQARRRGLSVHRLPIPGAGLPQDVDRLRALASRLAADASAGRRVVVHCRGGLGRTGLVAGCVLIEMGLRPAEALAALRKARGPGCPETDAQRSFPLAYRASGPAARPTNAPGAYPDFPLAMT